MLAKKCDRCGRYFDHYGFNKAKAEPNGCALYYFDKARNVKSHYEVNANPRTYDLCPECMEGLNKYLTMSEVIE